MEPVTANSTPRHVRWSVVWSVTRFGLLIFFIGLALSLLALPWLHLSWWKVFRRCVSIATALSLWISIRFFEHRSLRSYGFSSWRAGKRQFLFGLLLGVGTIALLLGVYVVSGVCRINMTPDTVRLWGTILGFLPAVIIVSCLEELAFRGFLLQHLLVYSQSVAVIFSSMLYAVVHLKINPRADLMLTGFELIGLFLLGVVLCVSYLQTRQLYLAVGLHAILAYVARTNKLLFEFSDQSPAWLVGTNRLVNGMVTWVVLLGMGLIIIAWTRTKRQAGRG